MQMMLPLDGWAVRTETCVPDTREYGSDFIPDLESYDVIIAFFSAGKDSIAMTLRLIELGYRPELHHHRVDGQEGVDSPLKWDWPVTDDYTRKVAQALRLDLYFSWRDGGLTGELLKDGDRTKASVFETPDGSLGRGGGLTGAIASRRRFPQVSPDLRVRWCSGVAKVDVGAALIAGQDRFKGKRILVVTGERAQESAARARYATFEPHRTHQPGPRAQRHVDHWRPVLHWDEAEVWDIIRRHRIVPHPCYFLGWSRASCMTCVFNSKDSWSSVRQLDPSRFSTIVAYEKDFGCTMRRDMDIVSTADAGTPYDMDPEHIRLAMSETYDGEIITDDWKMPAGAFREGGGPT